MKKYLLGFIAVIVAIGFSAFNAPSTPKAFDGEKWFQLASGGNSETAADYSLYGDGSTAPGCTGSYVCAILAVPNSQNQSIPNLGTIISTRYRTTP